MDKQLLPHEVEAWSTVEHLARIGKEVLTVFGEQGEQAPFIFCRTDDGGFPGDSDVAGRVHQCGAEASDAVGQSEGKRLLPGPDLAGGKRLDLVIGGISAGCDIV